MPWLQIVYALERGNPRCFWWAVEIASMLAPDR